MGQVVFSVALTAMALSLAVSALALVRNELIFGIRGKKLAQIHDQTSRNIEAGLPWMHLYDNFNAGPSYGNMMWDLRKWTYESFYGKD